MSSDQQESAGQPFRFGCSTDVFPLEELSILNARGEFLEALAAGEIAAAGPEDEHFLKVDRDEAAPVTIAERAWLRLKGRREYERDFDRQRAAAPPPPPAEDYGIIEWDKEKCWW